jgi:hypothetical protein
MGGDTKTSQFGIYGTQGVANPNNLPGARYSAYTWVDREGNFWIFGDWAKPRPDLGTGTLAICGSTPWASGSG